MGVASGFVRLFSRLILRPLAAEPLRTALTVFAVALGVAVVVAIDLASGAATGSFRSSMETLTGKAAFEIVATGGVDERLLGRLVRLPYPFRFDPRIEGYATVESTGATIPFIGLDLIGTNNIQRGNTDDVSAETSFNGKRAIWASAALGWESGERVRLIASDRAEVYEVRGIVDGGDPFVVADIAVAQEALMRAGRIDRVEVSIPEGFDAGRTEQILRAEIPAGVDLRPFGASTQQNRKMLEAFRWNLRVLSYISLIVGAFLIYNTISVSVVRRRAEIGVLRAAGAGRVLVRLLFLVEAGLLGLAGSLIGLALGDVMARGAVTLLGATVRALYVSSAPGAIAMTPGVILEALVIGAGVSLAAAFAPAREASLVAPVEAMARGQHEHSSRLNLKRGAALSLAAAGLGAWAAMQPAWAGKPIFGYTACFLMIAAAAFAMPAMITLASGLLTGIAGHVFGVEGMLAARGLASALPRTSVLVAALATAVAMMVSVGIMVGSFRRTVAMWMDAQLQADLYLRPAGAGAAGRHPTMDVSVADRIEKLPEVRAVDRFRLYEISYAGLPAFLGAGQSEVIAATARLPLLYGSDRAQALARLPQGDYCLVSEPFANKHGVTVGNRIRVSLGDAPRELEVLGIYYDYSSERGYIIVDRGTLLRYLPDPAVSNLAVYLRDGIPLEEGRRAVEQATAGRKIVIFSNQSLRTAALEVFDRTFAITWALEAVAIVVAVLGIAGALLALVIDRRRELGLLRFLGGSAPQVRRLLLCEAGMLGLLANGAGLLLGWALSLVLIFVINKQSFGWTIQFHWPVALLVFALGLVFVATVLAGLYPARIAVNLNPIEVVHEE